MLNHRLRLEPQYQTKNTIVLKSNEISESFFRIKKNKNYFCRRISKFLAYFPVSRDVFPLFPFKQLELCFYFKTSATDANILKIFPHAFNIQNKENKGNILQKFIITWENTYSEP